MLALVERVVAAIEGFLTLHDTVLEGTKLALALLLLGLSRLLVLNDLFLGLEQGLFPHRFRSTLGIADQALRLRVSRLDPRIGLSQASALGAAHGDGGDGGPDHEADDADYEFHAQFSLIITHSSTDKAPPVLSHGRRDIC